MLRYPSNQEFVEYFRENVLRKEAGFWHAGKHGPSALNVTIFIYYISVGFCLLPETNAGPTQFCK